MRFTRSDLQTHVLRDLVGRTSTTGDNRLTTTLINSALTLGEQQFYRDTHFRRRITTYFPATGQAWLPLPVDMYQCYAVRYHDSTTELEATTEHTLHNLSNGFQNAAVGTPSYWYARDNGNIGVSTTPDCDDGEALLIEGYIIPYSIGNALTSVQRTTNVVTCATSAAHGLTTGDFVNVSKITTDTTLNGLAEVTVTSATAFTYADVGTNNGSAITNQGYLTTTNLRAIATAVRASNIVTIVTEQPHNLLVGDSILIDGVTSSTFDGAATVASVTDIDTFTYAQSAANESSTLGKVAFAGGTLPMVADTDVSSIPALYELAIPYYAVWWLSQYIITDQQAQSAGERDMALYQRLVAQCKGDWVL